MLDALAFPGVSPRPTRSDLGRTVLSDVCFPDLQLVVCIRCCVWIMLWACVAGVLSPVIL